MSQQIINVGAVPNDGTADPIRVCFNKCNENFSEIYKSIEKHNALYVPAVTEPPAKPPVTVAGKVAIVVDINSNKMYFYSGGAWRLAGS